MGTAARRSQLFTSDSQIAAVERALGLTQERQRRFESSPPAPRRNPSRPIASGDCRGTCATSVRVVLDSAPCTWQRWLEIVEFRASGSRHGCVLLPRADPPSRSSGEVSNFMRHLRLPRATQPTLPSPIQPESPGGAKSDHRLRRDDDGRRTSAGPQAQQPCPQEAAHLRESNAPTLRPSKHVYLVTEGKILQLQGRAGLEAGADSTQEGDE